MQIIDVIAPHAAAVTASVVSFGTTLSLAAGAPIPDGIPSWIPWVASMVGPALIFVLQRLLGAAAAKKRSLAASKDRRSKRLFADADPANDAEAHSLEDEVDELEATADAYDAMKRRD